MLWKEKRPLVRRLKLAEDEWVVMAVNPWQAEDARTTVTVSCGANGVDLTLAGRHTEISVVDGDRVTKP